MNNANNITDERTNYIVIGTLLVGVAGMAIATGMSFPLVTLSLERLGYSTTVIGLNSAMGSVGILVVGFLSARLLARFNGYTLLIIASLTGIGTLLTMPWTTSAEGWFALRFLEATGLGFLWLVSETWINALAPSEKRGQIMGLYGMAFSGGFASGPLLVALIGSHGWEPFAITAGILAVSSLPMIIAAFSHYAHDSETPHGYRIILRLGRFIFFLAFAAGLFEATVFALMPLYTLAEGLNESWTLYALSALSAGGIALQYPMGRLADVVGRYALMVMTALGVLTSVIAIPYVIDTFVWLMVVLFFFGGSIFGLYTLGLILLGDTFKSANLVSATALFIIVYESGSIVGPAITGVSMDIWPEDGFIGFLLAFSVGFMLVTMVRRKKV